MTAPDTLTVRPIGILQSCFQEKFGTPRQPGLVKNAPAKLKIFPEFIPKHSLEGLEGFSHVWLIAWMHLCTNKTFHPKIHPPRLRGAKMGVFATRSPHRPNPIAISAAKIERIEVDTVYLSGTDLINGTPILDLKPYLTLCDSIPDAHCGWVDDSAFPELKVEFSDNALKDIEESGKPELKNIITGTLSSDPRNRRDSSQMSDGFEMGFFIANHDVHFSVSGETATILGVETGKKFVKKFRRNKK